MTPSKPQDDPEIRLVHDVRATHDMAALRFGALAGGKGWAVLRLTSDANSGGQTIPGAYVQGGRIVNAAREKPVIIYSGAWRVLATAGKEHHADGNYSWEQPRQISRVATPEERYSPFIHGGTVLCKLPSAGKSLQEFNPVFLLFPDWVPLVSRAAVYVEANAALFESSKKPTPLAADHWRMLLQQTNGILVALAFRRLVETGELTHDQAAQSLALTLPETAAVLIYLLLMTHGPETQPLVDQANRFTESCGDPAKLRDLALGGYTTMTFGDTEQQDRAEAILKITRRRCDALGVNVHADVYWKTLFDFADLL